MQKGKALLFFLMSTSSAYACHFRDAEDYKQHLAEDRKYLEEAVAEASNAATEIFIAKINDIRLIEKTESNSVYDITSNTTELIKGKAPPDSIKLVINEQLIMVSCFRSSYFDTLSVPKAGITYLFFVRDGLVTNLEDIQKSDDVYQLLNRPN